MQIAVAWAGGCEMANKKLLENKKSRKPTEFRHM